VPATPRRPSERHLVQATTADSPIPSGEKGAGVSISSGRGPRTRRYGLARSRGEPVIATPGSLLGRQLGRGLPQSRTALGATADADHEAPRAHEGLRHPRCVISVRASGTTITPPIEMPAVENPSARPLRRRETSRRQALCSDRPRAPSTRAHQERQSARSSAGNECTVDAT